MTIWLYSNTITARLEWIAHWLGMQLNGSSLRLTTNPMDIGVYDAVITYAEYPLSRPAECHIVPQGLLHADLVRPQPVAFTTWQGLPVFFAQQGGDLPFDILAASFYLVQRYEEYLPHSLDEYKRYNYADSLAYKNNFLHRPLVDEWINALRDLLQRKFYTHSFDAIPFRLIPTYDVDIAWSYKHKGWFRHAGGIAKALGRGNVQQIRQRLAVVAGIHEDPYYIFGNLERLHTTGHTPIFFWLLAEKAIGYDKNIAPDHPALLDLIQHTDNYASNGIHLSWQAENDGSRMARECAILEETLEKPVTQNRFHYLNIHLPHSYRRMLEHCPNITDDYSMAYGTANGFRASTSRPYRWFNIVANQPSKLTIHPAAWMDANCIFEEKLSPLEGAKQLIALRKCVEQAGGNFISIAHNHFIGTEESGRNWWNAYLFGMGKSL